MTHTRTRPATPLLRAVLPGAALALAALLAGCPLLDDGTSGPPRLALRDGGGRLEPGDRPPPRDDDLDPTLPPPISPGDRDAGDDGELVPPELVDGGPPGGGGGPADGGGGELVPPELVDGGAPGGGEPGSPPTRCYEEPVHPEADLSDLVGAYGGADWKDDVIRIVARRWPGGELLLTEQRDDPYFDRFADPSSWGGMMEELATLVHEETHLFNAYHAQRLGRTRSVYVRGDSIYFPPELDGFPRSEIYAMVDVHPTSYADTYLTGEQGSRGFLAILDEASCYIDEMAAMAVLGDQYRGSGFSSRDGAVAFLYYVELYLRRARTAHPDFYEMARADAGLRDHVLTQWLRVHFFLPYSERHASLGIHDRDFRAAMYRAENLAELEAFLGVRVGDSSCVLP